MSLGVSSDWARWGIATFTELTVEENLRIGAVNRTDGEARSDLDRWYSVFPRLAERRNQEDLQRLSARLVDAQEQERRNLARELHDEVGQALTAIKMSVGVALRSPDRDERARAALDDARGIAENTLHAVRDLSQLAWDYTHRYNMVGFDPQPDPPLFAPRSHAATRRTTSASDAMRAAGALRAVSAEGFIPCFG